MEDRVQTHVRQSKKGNKMTKTAAVAGEVANDASTLCCPTRTALATLEEHITARLAQMAPTAHGTARVDRCLVELRSMMKRLGHNWEVCPFGSYANGFSTVHSDLDVTCHTSDQWLGAEAKQQANMDLQMWIVPMLQEHSSFSVVKEIFNARVPLLRLRFENILDVDLTCHNTRPLSNTRLLKAYSDMDPRIKDLGIAIKLWAKAAGICDATNSSLSSYAFMLLVVYFLQVHADVQLPVLPVEAFELDAKQEDDERVIASIAGWRCRLSLLELMERFFAFYSNHDPQAFFWGSEVVSVRCGARMARYEPSFSQLPGTHIQRLQIEDPYQLERNLHGVLGGAEEEQLRFALSEAWNNMQAHQAPVGLQSSGDSLIEDSLAALPVNAFLPAESRETSHPGIVTSDLNEALRMYKVSTPLGSSSDSTTSGGTPPYVSIGSSDDDSGTESVDRLSRLMLPDQVDCDAENRTDAQMNSSIISACSDDASCIDSVGYSWPHGLRKARVNKPLPPSPNEEVATATPSWWHQLSASQMVAPPPPPPTPPCVLPHPGHGPQKESMAPPPPPPLPLHCTLQRSPASQGRWRGACAKKKGRTNTWSSGRASPLR